MGQPSTEEGNLSLIDSGHAGRAAYFSLNCLLLCSVLLAGGLDVRAVLAASGQSSIEALHAPELDAGFHLLYELKPEDARNHFGDRQNAHPEDPLGSASKRRAICLRSVIGKAS
jgi:hypothetical protein